MKTPTTKPTPRTTRAERAQESLIKLVTDYAPGVPFLAALLAAQPEPAGTEADRPSLAGFDHLLDLSYLAD